MFINISKLVSLITVAILLVACGQSTQVVTIRPVGNEMKYAQTEFTVKAGSSVKVIMENTATSAAMVHNVVILKKGTDIKAFAQQALAAGPDKGYMPATDDIISATGLAQPGQSTETTFTAPTEPGEYIYICTYPGHWSTMQGVMKVVE